MVIEARWNGAVVARSEETVVVEGNHYFPRSAVDPALLEDNATTTRCGWKGEARYHSLTVAGQTNRDAAWYYPDPLPAAAQIKGRIAFWKGVEVVEA